jgi:hypothetical protein
MKHVSEGNRIRTYVLVTLPLGDKNVLKSTKDAEARAPGAFKELDNITNGVNTPAPANTKAPDSVGIVNPDGSSGTLNLLQVDNAELRARRAEALKKPGAVVGQLTLN